VCYHQQHNKKPSLGPVDCSLVKAQSPLENTRVMGCQLINTKSISAALYVCATALLVGCSNGAPQTPFGLATFGPEAMQSNRAPGAVSAIFHLRESWMAAEAKRENLLYVAAGFINTIDVYSYPKGNLVGQLTNIEAPQGECVDKNNNVWIAEFYLGDIVEYAHGGTKPVATLTDPWGSTAGCSIDPTTGDLAVTSRWGPSSKSGAIAIYKGAQGKPKMYSTPDIFFYFFCSFDNNGNLFVNGYSSGSAVTFAELHRQHHRFTTLTLQQTIVHPAGIEWYGNYLAVGDLFVPEIYEFTIHHHTGIEVSSTPLNGVGGGAGQFFIDGKTVIVPVGSSPGTIGYWPYPSGGTPIKIWHDGNDEPDAAVVSNAN